MNGEYSLPRSDFEVIEKFDSYKDDTLAVKMVELYQKQRDVNISLEDAYTRTLQVWDISQ